MKRYNKLMTILLLASLLMLVGCSQQLSGDGSNDGISIDGQGIVANDNGDDSNNAATEGFNDLGDGGSNQDTGNQASNGASDAGETAAGDDSFEINRAEILSSITASMEKEFSEVADPYLIGWTYSLKIAGISEELLSSLDMTSLFESMVVANQFQYNVGRPLHISYTPNGIFMMVGKTNEVADPFASQTAVSATNTSQSVSHKGPGDVVFENDKVVVQIASIITSSHEVEFTETVEIEGWDTTNGTLNLVRLGPGSSASHLDIDVDASVEDGIVTATIPQGDYALVFKRDDFSLEIPVNQDYIFVTEGHDPIYIVGMKTVTGTVYKGSETSDDAKPEVGATVELIPLITDAGIEGDFTDETDSNGNYSINDVPIGVYQVVVNGVPQHEITINTLGNSVKPTEDIYLPGDVFDVTIHMVMTYSTIDLTFDEVYISNEYSQSINIVSGVNTIVKDAEVYPDSTTIISQLLPAYPVYWENYFAILKTDNTVGGYLTPNSYYIDFSFGVDWYDTEANMPEWLDGSDFGLPYYDGDLQSGLLDTEAFENLLYNGDTFTFTKSIPYFGDTTVTIEPHE